jgi:hypothetical protein
MSNDQNTTPTEQTKPEKATELTAETKQAILSFLTLVIAPPAIILSVLTFLLGFFIRQGALDHALEEAKQKMLETLKEVNQKMVDPIIKASVAAEAAKKSAEDSAETAKKIAEQSAEDADKTAKSVENVITM